MTSVASVLGFFGQLGWWADLCSHFRVQYAVGLAVAALLLTIHRQRRLALMFGLLALANGAVVLPRYFQTSGAAPASGPTYRAMLINVNTRHGDVVRVAAAIRECAPDIVVLEEVDDGWVAELRRLMPAYPHTKIAPRDDNFGIGLYSRFPFAACRVISLGSADLPSIVAEVETPTGRLTILATHPLPPAGPEYSRYRNEQLGLIPQQVRAAMTPVLLLGDLNVTPWSHFFRRLLKDSGLRDSAQGRGLQTSWPSFNPLMRIPIDHALHSPSILIANRRIGPAVGSDHYPVIVDFAFAR